MDKVLSALQTGLLIIVIWLIPIILGVRCAKRKGISPHWMWFGLYPFFGWIAYAIIFFSGSDFTKCPSCDSVCSRLSRFCLKCKAEIPLGTKPLFRWRRSQVQCATCRGFIKIGSSFCSSCGAPTPRLICPGCGSSETTLRSGGGYLLGTSIGLLIVGGLIAGQIKGDGSRIDSVLTAEFVLLLVMSIVGFTFIPSRFTKFTYCSYCRQTRRIRSASPEVVEVAPKIQSGDKGDASGPPEMSGDSSVVQK